MISRVVDQATANPINFGEPVLQGASEQTVQSVNGGSGTYRGIAVRDPTLPASAGDQYVAGLTCAIMTKGVIWVTAGVGVTAAQPVYFTSAGALTNCRRAIPSSPTRCGRARPQPRGSPRSGWAERSTFSSS